VSPELAAWRKAGTFRLHRGHRVFFRDESEGPVLLVLHGFPSSSYDFAPLWSDLIVRFRVVTLDLLGFGFSEKPPKYPYSLKDQANLVEALGKQLGLKKVHVLAHDYGVSVAQELIARMKEATDDTTYVLRITSVCYLNGGLFPEMHRPRLAQRVLAGPLGALVAKFVGKKFFARSFQGVFGLATQPSAAFLNDTWDLLEHEHGRAVLPKLLGYMKERKQARARWVDAVVECPVPMRLINGVADPVSGGHLADHFAAQVEKADVVRLKGIGHYPQIEAPEQVAKAFFDFHDRLGTSLFSS
jgi:pimeloyl-ACP methyl ester carboxylesterase